MRRWIAGACLVTLGLGATPALSEIRTTVCTFPKLVRSTIMPEVRIIHDTETSATLVDDAFIARFNGEPRPAQVDHRKVQGREFFIVEWRVERVPAKMFGQWGTHFDFILRVDSDANAVIESFNGFDRTTAKGSCS